MSTGSRVARALPAVLYALGIFCGGTLRMPSSLSPFAGSDKLGHALVFWGFVYALELALSELAPRPRRVLGVGLASAVGLALELVQGALPHRSADAVDWAADTVGAVLGAFSLVWLAAWRRARRAGAPRESGS